MTSPSTHDLESHLARYGKAVDEADLGSAQADIVKYLEAQSGDELFLLLVRAAEGKMPELCRPVS